jgi:hypothetical protein
VLQTYYDIKKEKQKTLQGNHPEISRLRKSLFWDTNINTINWESQSKAVIRRVFERGNISEKKEIIRFYGTERIKPVIREAVGKTYIKAKRS